MAEEKKTVRLSGKTRSSSRLSSPEINEGQEWLTTYGDLMTLLLVFFVLFYTFSITGQLPLLSKALERYQDPEMSPAVGESIQPQDTDIQGIAGDAGEILIYIPSKVLFDLGKAEIKPEAYKVLHDAVQVIKEEIADVPAAQIRVEGYTDDLPIFNWRYKSNWELSAARAVSVVKYLIEEQSFPPYRLQAMGYGEYNPVAPNDTPENRQKNRRVELKIVKPPGKPGDNSAQKVSSPSEKGLFK